ncbi:iron-containing alcohol dehydrogenase [Haloferula sp. A504]|uniref:iron-containing alcohol dehydrogenase n=1 Tax=Haloferula sp. A504 TaxID=3373601 RepID=UPI0031C7B726|nr:iron-containing alcohol dehydrogenase [Verrucomicrobiaceae bacterium E54]
MNFDTRPCPRLLFGPGRLAELPECVRALGASKPLIITDPGIVAAGHVERAATLLGNAGLRPDVFEESQVNPTESDVAECRDFAARVRPDLIIGLGGGSSLDTAKGCNFLLSHPDKRMSDFHGYGHATAPMLPFIAVPTTAGTGSECQSYTVLARDGTHEKMACGDPKALARIALLDPELTASQPEFVATLAALDALSHAIESAVSTKHNPVSSAYSRQAFKLLSDSIESLLTGTPSDCDRAQLLLGAAMAGSAIENSMLGAAHATANPLTARYNLPHGLAVWTMLPHVVRFNMGCRDAAAKYGDLSHHLGQSLPDWIDHVLALANLPPAEVPPDVIPQLVADAFGQWTGRFNPRPLTPEVLTSLYESALTAPVS